MQLPHGVFLSHFSFSRLHWIRRIELTISSWQSRLLASAHTTVTLDLIWLRKCEIGLYRRTKYLRARSGIAGRGGWEREGGIHCCGGSEQNIQTCIIISGWSVTSVTKHCHSNFSSSRSLIPGLRNKAAHHLMPVFFRYFFAHLACYLVQQVRSNSQAQKFPL